MTQSDELSIVTYEIYVLEPRGWRIQSRHPREEKDIALRDAKEMEKALDKPVRVTRESYFPRRNASEETTVYITSSLTPEQMRFAPPDVAKKIKTRAAPAATKAAGPPPRRASESFDSMRMADLDKLAPESFEPEPAPRKAIRMPRLKPRKSGGTGVLVRILGVTASSMVLAGLVTGVASLVMNYMALPGLSPGSATYGTVLFGIFVVTFLLAALPMLMRYVPMEEVTEEAQTQEPVSAATPEPVPAAAAGYKPPDWNAFDPDAGEESKPGLWTRLFGGGKKNGEEDDDEDDPLGALDQEISADDFAEEEEEEKAPDALDAEEEDGQEDDEKDEQAGQKDSPALEQGRMELMKFLGGVVSALKTVRPQLDAYNKFGVNLIIAGASEALVQRHGFNEEERDRLMIETLEVIGAKPDLARTFFRKYDEYMLEPRYMQMAQVGREAMERFLDGADQPYADLGPAVETWNKPQSKSAHASIVTVYFTDIVGSTAMTQKLGDSGAQEVVRVHNNIVRSALTEFGGREIKHTGDGIMASFNNTSSAVESTIAIQKAVARHNERRPDLPLHLTIGMNAGEPIAEEDDLFGSTIQIAARVCSKATTDEILVSNVVRELCAGKPFTFIHRGNFEMKGLAEPQPLYAVIWQDEEAGESGEGKQPDAVSSSASAPDAQSSGTA